MGIPNFICKKRCPRIWTFSPNITQVEEQLFIVNAWEADDGRDIDQPPRLAFRLRWEDQTGLCPRPSRGLPRRSVRRRLVNFEVPNPVIHALSAVCIGGIPRSESYTRCQCASKHFRQASQLLSIVSPSKFFRESSISLKDLYLTETRSTESSAAWKSPDLAAVEMRTVRREDLKEVLMLCCPRVENLR
jgi:hypothetical protein